MLDPVQQRVLGVLIEKELTVPDSYPLTETTLLGGCNQKSNREPEMTLESRDVYSALVTLRDARWVTRVETSARATRYRHEAEAMLSCTPRQKAVLCELLIRGPQAPGALKPRVARLGFVADAAEIRDVLEELAARGGAPLVEELPRRPRERDQRWTHLLGPSASPPPTGSDGTTGTPSTRSERPKDDQPHPADARSAPSRSASLPDPTADNDLDARVEDLEREVADLRAEVVRLREMFE